MKRIVRVTFLLLFLFGALKSVVVAGSPALTAPISSRDEVHQYSVLVKDNGSASTFFLVNNLGFDRKGGSYRLTLPEGATGPVNAWYVDEGVFEKCIQPTYPSSPCYEAVRTWVPIEEMTQEGDSVTVIVPPTKGHVSLGVTWKLSDVTEKRWWGRKATITTPVVDHFVSYSNVSVDFPDGVYVRDKAVGPVRWGDMESGVMMSQPGSGMNEKMAFTPEMFDRIGGTGDVVKSKSNLAPGESYAFTLLTATSRWKLFIPELATMAGAAIGLILVTSFLLRLIVGRKPLGWYLAVVALLVVLVSLVVWLVSIYRTVFSPDGGGRPYPVMMKTESAPS